MNPRTQPTDATKQLFDSDSDISDEPQQQSPQKMGRKSRTLQQTLYQQNLQKYMEYLGQFATKAEIAQESIFADGSTYVNHPLIQMSQINFEKNFGLFDIIDIKEQKNKNNYVRTMTIFTYLDNQVNKVIDILQYDLYDTLLMYGEQKSKKVQLEAGQVMTARMFPTYRKIFDLVRKLMSFIENLVVQLYSIINRKQPLYKSYFKGMNFDYVLNIIGRALRAVHVIDAIVQNNPNIDQHWQAYLRMIKLARKQPQKFNMTTFKLKKLQKMMSKFESTVLSKRCMDIVMQLNFDETIKINNLPGSNIRSNKELKQLFQIYLQKTLQNIDQNLGTVSSSSDEQKRLLDMLCVFALYKKLFPGEDYKQFWKKAWSFQKKIPIIEAHSFVCVYISTFMNQYCPISKKPSGMDPKDQNAFIQMYIQRLNEKIGPDFVNTYTKFCVWVSRMESIITSNSSLKDLKQSKSKLLQQRLSNRIFMICEGVNIIYELNKLTYLSLLLHINQQSPINKQMLGSLILGLESLKATAYMLKKKSEAFDTTILTKTVARDIAILVQPYYHFLRKQCQQNPKKVKQYEDRLQALSMILRILRTPISELKICILRYSLNFINSSIKVIIKPQNMTQIVSLINKLQVIAYMNVLIQRYQRCDYLYYCKDVLPSIFQWKRQNPSTCKRLQFLFDSFQDSAFMLKKCQHLQSNHEIFEQYRAHILLSFQENYMLPLKRQIEDFLRISIHSMLIQKLEGMNPFNTQMADLIKLIQFEKLRIFDTIVDLRIQISKSFNETFYNMNTLNIYDMETYEQMRIMANCLFNLQLHNVFLPNQSIAQGKFDIFTIIRNIPKFIESYNYNLLSQRFLQITTDSKMISSIGIQQISDSIRTHGLGILSTTVNAFYKFIVGKIQAFNKFMHNDQIRSVLMRERKWMKAQAQKQKGKEHQNVYPYEKAKQLYKEIKKIARFEDESNLLDQLRKIITQIGNSLGFIRLLRSASLNYSSKSVQFLPIKIQLNESLSEIAQKAQLSQTTVNSCKELDDILKTVDDRFSDKVDYLNLMVKLFSKISTKENKHLQSFYILIPALSLNFIEHITRGKQQINKKLSSNAFIYDDGLVLGTAYLLCLLRQNLDYKTLHWDDSTELYIDAAKNYSKDLTANTGHSAKMREDLNMQNQLLIKKLDLMETQFKFFHYNMISSNVLFKSSDLVHVNGPASPPTNTEPQQPQ